MPPVSLPTFIIIGAQKAGTTSLHSALGQHPDIGVSTPKELNYFAYNAHLGQEWYESHFGDEVARGESCPQYTLWPEAPARIHALVPDVRLIYLVRDPVDRIVSGWIHAFAAGRESRTLDDVVRGPEFPTSEYVVRASYGLHVARYLEYFARDQLLILDFEELIADAGATSLPLVFEHVGVPVHDGIRLPTRHSSAGKRRRPAPARMLLGARGGWQRQQPAWKFRVSERLTRHFGRPVERPLVTTETRDRIKAVLADDRRLFRDLTATAPDDGTT